LVELSESDKQNASKVEFKQKESNAEQAAKLQRQSIKTQSIFAPKKQQTQTPSSTPKSNTSSTTTPVKQTIAFEDVRDRQHRLLKMQLLAKQQRQEAKQKSSRAANSSIFSQQT